MHTDLVARIALWMGTATLLIGSGLLILSAAFITEAVGVNPLCIARPTKAIAAVGMLFIAWGVVAGIAGTFLIATASFRKRPV